MEKNRLEAFSDGVFAIVITLLILEIRLPEVDYDQLRQALVEVLPRIFAYIMSFIIIGLYWISHHNSFHPVKKVDRVFLWMNMLLLLFVSFIPFPTALHGRYPFKPLPIIMYGATLIACNAVGLSMGIYLRTRPHLTVPDFREKYFRPQMPIYALVNGTYAAAMAVAPFRPGLSYLIYAGMTVFLIVFLTRWNMRRDHAIANS